jgi:kumamolisin
MTNHSKLTLATLALLLSGLMSAAAQAGVPYPTAATPSAIDRGELKTLAGATPISVTIALRLPALSDAEDVMKAIYTPGDPQFHQFLTADEFTARFAPTDADVSRVVAALAQYGLTAERTTATTLRVTGLPANMESAFVVSLHSYEVPAHDSVLGYSFHSPVTHPTIPAEISASVAAVAGLDTRPSFHPNSRNVSPAQTARPPVAPSTSTGDAPGSYTVIDFAKFYDVNPLYKRGLSGKGRTLAIVTLASFTPSDAYAYWRALGLDVDSHRIRVINIDGGPGAPSDDSGSVETTLDVEQSGGIAPGAKVIVYQAPNTNQAFLDAFAAATESNSAETLSTSWGDWEWFLNLENGPVTDPITGKTTSFEQALHELLVRAAIQGQTWITAQGDGGAYEAFSDLGCSGPYSPSVPTSCSVTLSVGAPGTDTAMTAAGGTTLPGPVPLICLPTGDCVPPRSPIFIPHERVWGWDYFVDACAAFGYDPFSCGIFPVGSGGGVSIIFGEPSYQIGLPGIQRSQPHQVFLAGSSFAQMGFGLKYDLPAFYAGRNVPDISFNADPYTGYVVYYTSNVTGFSAQSMWGGTSFCAPQLNGVSALLGQEVQGRVGLLNYPLYAIAQSGQGYGGPGAPFHAIAYGDNWFYHGSDGYNLGVGLGTLDVANFADIVSSEF